MQLGIRRKQDDEGAVANFQQIAQSFWKDPQSSKSKAKEPSPESGSVSYVGGHFHGTFTNKDIETNRNQSEAESNPEETEPKISYKRYFD